MSTNWPDPSKFTTNNLVPTDKVGGRFKLLRELGSGALGTVYCAFDEDIKPPRLVSVKILHTDLLDDANALAEIDREVECLRQLDHPNIIRLIDYCQQPDNVYVVTDFADFGSLAQVMEERSNLNTGLPYERVAIYLAGICAAVDYAHSQKLIHRDLKPENILIDEDDSAKVADFSLAVRYAVKGDSRTVEAEAWGTPLYSAPEQWNGSVSPSSDIYALGGVVYYMLTGVPPYNGTPSELKAKHLFAAVPKLKDSDPTTRFSKELNAVVAKAMSKSPENRHATADELYQHFARAINLKSALGNTRFSSAATPEELAAATAQQAAAKKKGGFVIWLLGFTALIIFGVVGIGFIVEGDSYGLSRADRNRTSTAIVVNAIAGVTAKARLTSTAAGRTVILPRLTPRITSAVNSVPGSSGSPQPTETWFPTISAALTANSLAVSSTITPATEVKETNRIVIPGNVLEMRKSGNNRNSYSILSVNDKVSRWQNGAMQDEVNLDTSTTTAAYSPDGKSLVAGQKGKITLRYPDGKEVMNQAHLGSVSRVTWSADGSRFASGGIDGRLYIWSGTQGVILYTTEISGTSPIRDIAFAPNDNRLLAGMADGRLWIFDDAGKKLFSGFPLDDYTSGQGITAVGWSPDGKRFVAGSLAGTVITGEYVPGDAQYLLSRIEDNPIRSLDWSPDGKHIAIGMDNGNIYSYSTIDLTRVKVGNYSRFISGVLWQDDSTTLITAADDGQVRTWSVK